MVGAERIEPSTLPIYRGVEAKSANFLSTCAVSRNNDFLFLSRSAL
jgi:hypothetical protein